MNTAKRAPKRGRLSLLLGTAFASVMFVAAAQADQLANDLDASVDATFEVLALDHGGTGSVGLYVNAANGDGANGCNLNGNNENDNVTFRVASGDTGVATVTPTTTLTSGPNRTTISGSDFTVRQCSSPNQPSVTLQVAAEGSGSSTRSADITVTVVADNAPGTFVADTARFRVSVAPPANTAPTVTVTGVIPSASYPKGSVPSAGCTVSDTEDGLSGSTTAATPQVGSVTGPYAADAIGLQTVTCSYTDGSGLNAVASATYGIVDPSAPGVSPSVSGTVGSNGWYTSDVGLSWSVSEPQSPTSLLLTGCVPQSIVADQDETQYTCTASSAGGTTGPVTQSIKRDASPPTYDCGSLPAGWQGDNVVLSCTAQDAGPSGLASSPTFQLLTALPDGAESAAVATNTESLTDNAGNSASARFSFMVDRKAPALACASAPSAWSAVDVAIGCTAADGGSGLHNPDDATFQLTTGVPDGTETDDAATDSKSVADAVGNSATAAPIAGIRVDKKAPVVALDPGATSCSLPGSNDWCRGEQTAGFTVGDGGSGLADDGASSRSVTRSTSVNGAAVAIASGAFEDLVGNATPGLSAAFKIDSVAPAYDCGTVPTGWLADNVTLSCTAEDATSGVAGAESFQLSTALPAGQESDDVSTGSRLVADVAGNETTAAVAPFMIDRKAPIVECAAAPTAWSPADVSVGCTAADGGSGLDSPQDATFQLTTSVPDGTETDDASTGTHSVLDGVGNAAQAGPVSGARVDRKAPAVARNMTSDSCSLPGLNGWCRGTQTAAFTATDGGSGLADDGAAVRGVVRSTGDNGAAVSIASGPFGDIVGNSTTGISATFKIDSVAPVVTCASTPTVLARQLPGTVKATVTDATSGALAATVTGLATSSNGGSVALTGYDNAGNSTTVLCGYRVGSFTFEQPIDGHSLNIAKLGRVVPVKGVARVDGAAVTDGPLSIGAASRVDCATGIGSDEIEVYAAAGSSNNGNLFRWDAAGQKWIYNFDTSVLGAGNCYRLNVYYGGTVGGGVATGGALIDYFLLRANK